MLSFQLDFKRVFLGVICLMVLTACSTPSPELGNGMSTLIDLMSGLDGLTAEQFMAEAFERLLLRSPEQMTALGLVHQGINTPWDIIKSPKSC